MELPSCYRNHFHVKQLSFEVVKYVMTSSILKILMVLKNNYNKKILDLFAIFKAISISMNFCIEFSKAEVLPCEYR